MTVKELFSRVTYTTGGPRAYDAYGNAVDPLSATATEFSLSAAIQRCYMPARPILATDMYLEVVRERAEAIKKYEAAVAKTEAAILLFFQARGSQICGRQISRWDEESTIPEFDGCLSPRRATREDVLAVVELAGV